MVTFKKDKEKRSNLKIYLASFVAGFIIATFLVLYLVMHIVNRVSNNSNESSSNSDPASSEVTSSIEDYTSSSSELNPYSTEEAIINNIVKAIQELKSEVTSIANINYDEDYLYISALDDDNNLYIASFPLNDKDVDEVLESFILSVGVDIESIERYPLSPIPEVDIVNLSSFSYKEYLYKDKYNYYTDDTHEVVGISTIGKKDNKYISIINMTYNTLTSEISTFSGSISISDSKDSEYYKLLQYLYLEN